MAFTDIPPEVARKVLDDMRDYFAEPDAFKRDAVAVVTLNRLRDYQRQIGGKRLTLSDVKELFDQLRASE
jgi:hypothetical protein